MPVLVVGGRGFVGRAVVDRLLADGRAVHVLGPASPVSLPHGATQTVASIADDTALRETIARMQPRQVVNLAAFSSGPIGLGRSGEADPERMLEVNVLGFRRLLAACVEAGVERVVWTSSTVVYGRAEDPAGRIAEEAPRRAITQYGLSKVLAEDVARYVRDRHGLETVGLRIPLILGPGLWYDGAASVLKAMVRAAATGQSHEFVVPDITFDAMHVDDAGDLVATLLAAPPGLACVYNVAGFATTYREIATTLRDLVPGFAPRLVPTTPDLVFPLVSQARLEADTRWRHRRDLRAVVTDMLAEKEA